MKQKASRRLKSGSPFYYQNGKISSSICVACALRYFAGGSPYDIGPLFGIAYSEVLRSVWLVVDAVNSVSDFKIAYPADQSHQLDIAKKFEASSDAKFSNCGGAIDGLLIWIH